MVWNPKLVNEPSVRDGLAAVDAQHGPGGEARSVARQVEAADHLVRLPAPAERIAW